MYAFLPCDNPVRNSVEVFFCYASVHMYVHVYRDCIVYTGHYVANDSLIKYSLYMLLLALLTLVFLIGARAKRVRHSQGYTNSSLFKEAAILQREQMPTLRGDVGIIV